MSNTNSTRSVHDIISGIDDAISQAESSSQFSIEFTDDCDEDDDDSSFEEEVLEEEEAAMANIVKAALSGSSMNKITNKNYDLNHYCDMIQDEIEEDFNPLSILEKGSQQRKKMVDVRCTKKVLNELDTLQSSMKRLNAAAPSRSQDFQQRSNPCSVLTASLSQTNRTSIRGRKLPHLVEDEEMSFEESMCSESTADEMSISICSVSTSLSNGFSISDASKDIKLPPNHQMVTPRVNNRKSVFVNKKQPTVEGEAPERSCLLGLVSSNQKAGEAGSKMLTSSSIMRNGAKVEPRARQGMKEEVSSSSKGISNESFQASIASSISYIGSIFLGGSDSSMSNSIKDRSTSGSASKSTGNDKKTVAISTPGSKVGGKKDPHKICSVDSQSKSTHTFSVMTATPINTASAYQPPVLMDCEDNGDRVSFTKSAMSKESTSPKRDASSTAKRALQLLVDIESGSLDQHSGVKTDKAWSKKRKCVLIGVFIFLVICVIAVLAVLHIISVISLDGILPGQTSTANDAKDVHGPQTTNNDKDDLGFVADVDVWPTYQPTQLQQTPVPALLFYANWDTSKCTEEDSGTKKPWDVGYKTEDECCVANFSWDENSDCNSGENDAVSNGGDKDIVLSTPAPSVLAYPPVSSAAKYYADFAAGKCVQDNSTETNGKYQASYETEGECCQINFSWDVNGICYVDGVSTPAPAPTVRQINYYADWVAGKCVQDYSNQTNGEYQASYETEEECCQINFSWDANSICYVDGGYPESRNNDVESTVPSIERSDMPMWPT